MKTARETTQENTRETTAKYYLIAFSVLFAVVFVLSFAIGKYPISPGELLRVLFGKLTGTTQDWSNQVELVIFKIRMPRVLAGAMIGAGLSAAGAAYQGLFRNPLVSPDVLGASAGAGFGAALSLIMGLGYGAVTANAFIFSIAAVGIAYLVSIRTKKNPTLGMVLAGIMVTQLFTSATSFIKMIADPSNDLPKIIFWLFGRLNSIQQDELAFAAIPVSAGLLVLFLMRWKMNLLTMGEDEARSMGVNTRTVRIVIVATATLITAACVAISGIIGWVGLVIP
ncbi:MAG: iron ABC transporter permease, partial [Gracilibacteraceae bacterium]|nr:iron ABC transporter permease [Gracilibacteraceae bacterium]